MMHRIVMGASLVVLVLIGAVSVRGGQMPMGGQRGAQEGSRDCEKFFVEL